MSVKAKLFIFLFGLLCCIFYNEVNKYYVQKNNPQNNQVNGKSVVHNGTIWSIDNFWYLTQPKNFLEGKGFMLDPNNIYTSVRRTPGYSIFYMMPLMILGEKNTHRVIPYIQSVIFALSALALSLAVFNFTLDKKLAFLSGAIYAGNPFNIGFVYYTITEAIHPAFVIFGFYFLSRSLDANFNRNAVFSGLIFAMACLIRPLNGLALAAAVVVLLFATAYPMLERIKKVIALSVGFSFLVLPWMIRNYLVTNGEIIFLEKIYHEDPMYMGKKQTYLSKWWMSWGNPRQENFIDSLKKEIETNKDVFIPRFVSDLPAAAVQGYTKKELKEVFQLYRECMRSEMQAGNYGKYYKPTDTLPACEEVMKREFVTLISQYKKEAPFRYYIISPLLIRGKEFCASSFSSMYGSLNPPGRSIGLAQKLIKASMYLFNIALYISFFIFLFIRSDIRLKSFIAFFVISTFLFVVYNAHVEGRYLLAAYPFMIIAAATIFTKIIMKFKNRWHLKFL